MPPASSGYGKRLREVRAVLQMNQTEFTRLARIQTQGTVSDWETEKTVPPDGALRLIADRFQETEAVFQWLVKGGKRPSLMLRMFRKAEDKYAGLLTRFQALVRELPLLMFELDAEDRVVLYNAGRAEELELRPEEFLGKQIWEVFPHMEETEYKRVAQQVRQRQEAIGTVPTFHEFGIEDGARQYVASLVLLPESHVMVCVRRARSGRAVELGIIKGDGRKGRES